MRTTTTTEEMPATLTKLRKWGNSYGIGISKKMLGQLRATLPATFKVRVERSRLILDLERDAKAFPTLAEIVASYNPKDPPEYVNWGAPVGKEIW